MQISLYKELKRRVNSLLSLKYGFVKYLRDDIIVDTISDTYLLCLKYNKDITRDTGYVNTIISTALIRNISKYLGGTTTYYKYFVKRFILEHPEVTDDEIAKRYRLPVSKVIKYRQANHREYIYSHDVSRYAKQKTNLSSLDINQEESVLLHAVANGHSIRNVQDHLGWSSQKIRIVASGIRNKYES